MEKKPFEIPKRFLKFKITFSGRDHFSKGFSIKSDRISKMGKIVGCKKTVFIIL